MSVYANGTKIKKIIYGSTNIKKVYCNGVLVFNSDHDVTYQIKNQSWTTTVEDEDNASAVSSSNDTASGKMGEGDSFLGWTTTNGSTSPESTIICDRDGMKLYGIWKHIHVGSEDVNGGCYQGAGSTHDHDVKFTYAGQIEYDACGCTHQNWEWKCNTCGRTWSSRTNNSSNCTQGHNLSDNGSSRCPNDNGQTVYAVSCGKSEGTFCG